MTKRRLPLILITVLIVIACALGFSACTNGESPVESVIVSSLPKIVYYRGDPFALNGAKITVYYENGTSEVVPLDLTMISDFDAEKTGEQILTVSYKG
ncbi:MAG TPA: bacterial Ig-like domain-containing protein, partial [Clostridia bacterium]|nr:bacterial Ig-like domain-containing protein [Clostridia bacterium]